jgi:Tol biopolymer transport system component
VLADVTADARGGAWGPDGTIIFTPTYATPFSKVSAEGGAVTPFTELDQLQEQTSHRWPSFLPDGRHFLYFVTSRKKELQGIYVGSLDSKEVKFLLRATSLAAYARGSSNNLDHLLFMRDKRLMAQPFDPRKLQLTGEPTVVAEGVLNFPDEAGPTAYAAFSVSANGCLSYILGNVSLTQMGWFDRGGKPLGTVGSPGSVGEAAQSPDGQRIAVARSELNQLQDIWLHDLVRGTTTRLTFDAGTETSPVWSGDGSRIFFSKFFAGLFQKVSSGAGSDELLLKTDYAAYPDDWFSGKTGELLLFEMDSSNTKYDLWVLPLTGERKPYPVLQTPFNETHAQFSPDGRFVAYVSDESGRAEVYVQSFPASGGKWQISTLGGDQPQWQRDGRELFYMAPDKKLMAVPIVPGDSFAPGSPAALFATHVPSGSLTGNRNHFIVARDGQRFLVNNLLEEGNTQPITIVLNWAAALQQ